jgi:hypothetical protein
LFTAGFIDAATNRSNTGIMVANPFQVPRLSDIVDGLSNTMLICEDGARPAPYAVGKRLSTPPRYSGAMWLDDANEFILHGFDNAGLTQGGRCPMNCSNNNEQYSFHPGGCMVTLADGSTRFLSQTLELRLIARLITKSAGESAALPD